MNKSLAYGLILIALVAGLGVGVTVRRAPTGKPAAPVAQAKDKSTSSNVADNTDYRLSSPIHDFGKMVEGEAREASIKLEWPGDARLRIARTYASCGCLQVAPSKMIADPSESVDIQLKLHSLSKHGKQKVTYAIEIVEPVKTTVRGEVIMNVKRQPAKIMVRPATLNFGTIAGKKQASVDIYNLTKKPIPFRIDKLDGISIQSAKLIPPGKTARLTATADPGILQEGPLRQELIIHTELSEHHQVAVPIRGTVTHTTAKR